MIGEEEVINEIEKDKSVWNCLKVVNGGFFLFKLGEGKLFLSGGMWRIMSNSVRGLIGVFFSIDVGI